jgi:hypothetical protein
MTDLATFKAQEREIKILKNNLIRWMAAFDRHTDRIKEREKRIETLEAALQPFADPCIEHCSERCESECDSMEECPCFIARATLAGEKKDE